MRLLAGCALTLSKQAFHCRYGRAYLFNTVNNVRTGASEERLMTTGLHVVVDISCTQCASVVGWKYVRTASLRLASQPAATLSTRSRLTRPRARAGGGV